MNRKQKIIVSITGIFIVLLALVGLTYAYFLTRIRGNEEPKSISVTTANLELVYGDGNGVLLPAGLLEPSDENIKFYVSNEETDDPNDVIEENGTPIIEESKTFTVTNNGEDTSYTVLIEDTETKYANTGSYVDADGNEITYSKDQPTEFVSNDFRYTLICKKYNKSEYQTNPSTATSTGNCDGTNEQELFPINGGIIASNNILSTEVHVYELKMWYIDTGLDQSLDMNKSYQAKVNIVDIRGNNPFATGVEETDNKNLAYNIINNSLLKTNGTELINTPLTIPGKDIQLSEPTDNLDERQTITCPTLGDGISWYAYTDFSDVVAANNNYVSLSSCSLAVGKYIQVNTYGKYEPIIFKVESYNSSDNTVVIRNLIYNNEKNLLTTQDDHGISYYYRGNVEDNYVEFAEKCWKIVRIDGNGNIKLILEDIDNKCSESNGNWDIPAADGSNKGNFGYEKVNVPNTSEYKYIESYLNPVTESNKSMVNAFMKFQTEELSGYTDYLVNEWCLNDNAYEGELLLSDSTLKYKKINEPKIFNYDSIRKIKKDSPSLICPKDANGNSNILTKYNNGTNMYVGTLTVDETIYAGGTADKDYGSNYGTYNFSHYLLNSYQENNNLFWYTLSPGLYRGDTDIVYTFNYGGSSSLNMSQNGEVNNNSISFRPSVIIDNDKVEITGDGTKTIPYIISSKS